MTTHTSPQKTLVVLDSNALMHRAYHAMRPLTTSDGTPVQAVYGFISMFLSILEEESPTYFAAAFDTAAPTFRKEKCETYKAGRIKPPDEFYTQIPLIQSFLQALGSTPLTADGYEADDILATLVQKSTPELNLSVILVTSDRDALQLVSEKVTVHGLRGGYKKAPIFTPTTVQKRYGVTPTQFVDYKALIGDPSDNLPGVSGIGPKTATTLLQKYSTLEEIYSHLQEISPTLQKKLTTGHQDALFTQDLAKLDYHVPLTFNLAHHLTSRFNYNKALEFLKKLEFKNLSTRLYRLANPTPPPTPNPTTPSPPTPTQKTSPDPQQLSLF